VKTGAVSAVLISALLVFSAVETAHAQSASCAQLDDTLRTLSGNRDFASLKQNQDQARELSTRLRDAESAFVRGGCQAVLNAGQKLSSDCMRVARFIVKGREDYNKLAASIETGQAVAQQREVALQQIARFGCGTGSSARSTQTTQSKSPFAQLFEQLFGGGSQQVIEDFGYNPNGSTLRTVCVRSCDGYYWPISFSTVAEFLGDDAAMCANQCPGSEVALYYYHNPGEDAEDMVNLDGAPYAALENAFRYRQEYDSSCTCQAPISYGTIEIGGGGGTPGRATVAFADLSFPLPMRDPRRLTQIATIAAIHVPLPRPRPPRPGEAGAPEPGATAVVTAASSSEMRLIRFGDRVVRLVGPDTPYARSAAAGS